MFLGDAKKVQHFPPESASKGDKSQRSSEVLYLEDGMLSLKCSTREKQIKCTSALLL